jgi:hypothetical protein
MQKAIVILSKSWEAALLAPDLPVAAYVIPRPVTNPAERNPDANQSK